jgi:hypothetical protein
MVAQAGWVDKINIFKKWRDRNRVNTLLITGNYGRSRVLAALAQNKRKHPILLISPEANGQDELFFMPTRPEAHPIPLGQYMKFIEFLHPQRVIVLGDETYVPRRYVDQLLQNQIPTIILGNVDWARNADALAGIIDYKHLPRDYAGYIAKLEMAKAGAVPSDAKAAPAPMPQVTVPAPAVESGAMMAPMVVE